jgi:hypothetical protein
MSNFMVHLRTAFLGIDLGPENALDCYVPYFIKYSVHFLHGK